MRNSILKGKRRKHNRLLPFSVSPQVPNRDAHPAVMTCTSAISAVLTTFHI